MRAKQDNKVLFIKFLRQGHKWGIKGALKKEESVPLEAGGQKSILRGSDPDIISTNIY